MTHAEHAALLVVLQHLKDGETDAALVKLEAMIPVIATQELWLLRLPDDISPSAGFPLGRSGKISTIKLLRLHKDMHLVEAKALTEALPKSLGLLAPDDDLVIALGALGAKLEWR